MTPSRNPDETRARLLHAAFREVYENGYHASSLEGILERAGVTKGALYHHFENKHALACAIVDEVIRGHVLARWVRPLEGAGDPVGALLRSYREEVGDLSMNGSFHGCPLNNLCQEMATLDEELRRRLSGVLTEWRRGIGRALAAGQATGSLRPDVDPKAAATFIVAATEGMASVAKTSQSQETLRRALEGLFHYLESLRPPGRMQRGR